MSTVSIAPANPEGRGTISVVLPAGRWVDRLLNACLLGVAMLVLASYAVVAAAHWNDRFQVNFISGIYTALAARFNDGTLYPALFDGEHYGGTRYMPLPFVLQAGLARVTGDYLLAGKLLAYLLTAVLGLELFVILRRIGCGRCPSLALISLTLTSTAGFFAATTIRGDLLPVVLQLAAVLVGTGAPTSRRAASAGVLCTLAVLAKLTAGWAPLALAWFYFRRDRRVCVAFLGVWLGSLLASLVALHFATSGRMLANFTALSTAGLGWSSFYFRAPGSILLKASQDAAAQGLLIPAAVVGCLLAARAGKLNVYHVCLLCCLPIEFMIFADRGADYNHLIDLTALAVPVAGILWGALAPAPGLRRCVALVLAWGVLSSWATTIALPLRQVIQQRWEGFTEGRRPGKPLTNWVADDARILSEDAWVAVSRGQTPVILDPYALARMIEQRPGLADGLVSRVRAGEFDRIVLLRPADLTRAEDGEVWYQRHLGPALVQAVQACYRLAGRSEGYYVYEPKPVDELPQPGPVSR
jgi:hypothetical protein